MQKKINRLLVNICSDQLTRSKAFYTALFDFKVAFNSDWYIQLVAEDHGMELGIIDRKSELIPAAYQQQPQGFYLSFVVADVDALFTFAQTQGFDIVSPPSDTFYGQRRLLLKDPDGTLVDVSAPIAGFTP